MQLVKFSGKESVLLTAAAKALQFATKEENKHKKAREAAKEVATRLLLEHRQINVDLLPNKEIVVIQCDGRDTLEIKRKESERFDGKAFSLVYPNLDEEFTRPCPATYFDSLLP
jgi:hypothetical protein